MRARVADVAVILAAGAGARIGGTSRTPKPLLPLDGRPGGPTFLDWHVRCLAAAGVRVIYVVGNERTYGAPFATAQPWVRWLLNPTPPADCGSAASALVAWTSPHGILDGRSRVLLMDADVVYDPAVLALLGRNPEPRSKLLVCGAWRDTGEEVLVFGDPDPRRLGKGIAGLLPVRRLRCLGEATGIVLWEPADHAALHEATVRVVGARARAEHEDVTQCLLDEGRLAAVTFGAEHVFLEVDTAEDYARLVDEIAPRLRLPAVGPPAIAPAPARP